MKKYAIANWKMNGDEKFLNNYFSEIAIDINLKVNLVFCPPAPYIASFAKLLNQNNLHAGAQDCHFEDKGAFTGDLSAPMLKDLAATYVILGHSERRQYQFETSELVAKKAITAQKHDLIPVICVGETLAQREDGSYQEVIKKQLEESISWQLNKEFIIAYEPVWAIGTGVTPKFEQIKEVFALISAYQPNVSILYGGSVSSKNCDEFAKIENLSGYLVGSASLKASEFSKIALSLQ